MNILDCQLTEQQRTEYEENGEVSILFGIYFATFIKFNDYEMVNDEKVFVVKTLTRIANSLDSKGHTYTGSTVDLDTAVDKIKKYFYSIDEQAKQQKVIVLNTQELFKETVLSFLRERLSLSFLMDVFKQTLCQIFYSNNGSHYPVLKDSVTFAIKEGTREAIAEKQ